MTVFSMYVGYLFIRCDNYGKGDKIHASMEWAVVRSLDLARCDKYGKGGRVCVSIGWVVVCSQDLAIVC